MERLGSAGPSTGVLTHCHYQCLLSVTWAVATGCEASWEILLQILNEVMCRSHLWQRVASMMNRVKLKHAGYWLCLPCWEGRHEAAGPLAECAQGCGQVIARVMGSSESSASAG